VWAAKGVRPLLSEGLDWPADLVAFVEQHGVNVVWEKGEAALGYPPTWVTSAREIATVKRSVEEK
jgi:hypothetical protein